MSDVSVIVVGAGPVGLLAAKLAARNGISVFLFEREDKRGLQPRAIGISPPSLEILRKTSLDQDLIKQGIRVVQSRACSDRSELGRLDFSRLDSEYNFILSLPQHKTESVLETSVKSEKTIKFFRGYEVTGVTNDSRNVTVSGQIKTGKKFNFSGNFLLACDGGKSSVRSCSGISFQGAPYKETFLMGDFEDNSGWGREARIYFTHRGSVESFPLPEGRRRYILRSPSFIRENTTDFLITEIPARCGVQVRGCKKFWESGFGVQHFLAKNFSQNRIFLCGDAAHIMSPIGGQNMNTGFADAELAVWLVRNMLEHKINISQANGIYNRTRKQAATSALIRAEFMMKIGTSGGKLWSAVRNFMISLFFSTSLVRLLIPVFTMQSIPFRNLDNFLKNSRTKPRL